MIRTITYSVEQTVAFEVPSDVIRNCIMNNADPEATFGYSKIYAIKELRSWFSDIHGRKLGLKDAKDLVEKEAENVL